MVVRCCLNFGDEKNVTKATADISTTNGVQCNEIKINLPNIPNAVNDKTLVTFICNIMPDYVGEEVTSVPSGMGISEFDGITSALMIVDTSNVKNADNNGYAVARDADYINREKRKNVKDTQVDIGYSLNETDAANQLDDLHMIKTTTINKGESVYVKAFLSKKDADQYVICVMKDGEFINAFDGKKFMKIDCKNGSRILNYKLDNKFSNEEGMHTFQTFLVPLCSEKFYKNADQNMDINGNQVSNSVCTLRHRIKIK